MLKRECDESRKKYIDSARRKPKHFNNGQSATKPRIEERSTISKSFDKGIGL